MAISKGFTVLGLLALAACAAHPDTSTATAADAGKPASAPVMVTGSRIKQDPGTTDPTLTTVNQDQIDLASRLTLKSVIEHSTAAPAAQVTGE